jgi:tryptophan synthase alpha chain
MSLQDVLKAKVQAGRKLLVPYVCAGAPDAETTLPILLALAEAGADAIELGIPFSDPLMDGPVIQAASHKALKQGMTLAKALEIAAAFTARCQTPLIFMGSVNPLLRMGAEAFVTRATKAGVQGCILPDLPLEDQSRIPGMPQVQLVAPNTPDERVKALLAQEPPFLYCVTVFGVTGARTTTADYTLPFLKRMKALSQAPVLAGFGVSTPQQAVELASACDGVIIGSALIRAMDAVEAKDAPQAAAEFLKPIRQALDGAAKK